MNRMTFCSRSSLIAVALVLSSAACTGSESESANAPASAPRGEYHGEIWSDGMYPSVTEFYGETRDGRDGVYRFEYGDDVEEGVLLDCRRLKAQEYRCGWKDRWGSGQVDMKFSADFQAFTGVWSDEANPPSLALRWHGARR